MIDFVRTLFSPITNFPWVTAHDLHYINHNNEIELQRLLRTHKLAHNPEDLEQLKILQALKVLECALEREDAPRNFYEAFLECDEIEESLRMRVWCSLELFSNERHALVIAYKMGVMHASPILFAGFLWHILNQRDTPIDELIKSGLCHHFAQMHEPKHIASCYHWLNRFPSDKKEMTEDFLQKLDTISCYSYGTSDIYLNRVLSGKENEQAKKIEVAAHYFNYNEEKLNVYLQFFGDEFLVQAIMATQKNPELVQCYVQQLEKARVQALYQYPMSQELKTNFYSIMSSYLTPAQKNDLFASMDKWIFCASLPDHERNMLSDEQRLAVLETPINKKNAAAVCTVLYRDVTIKHACMPVIYHSLFACFYESPELFPESFTHFYNNLEIIRLVTEKVQYIKHALYQLIDEAPEFNTSVFYELIDEFRRIAPQRQLLRRLIAQNLQLPQGNYEFYAFILNGFYQKNPDVDLNVLISNIHQLVPHEGDSTEDINKAKERTLYEALIYIDDLSFLEKIITCISLNWNYTIAGKNLFELALKNGNVSFFQIYNKYHPAPGVLTRFNALNAVFKGRFSSLIMKHPGLLEYYFSLYPENEQLNLITNSFYLHEAVSTSRHLASTDVSSLKILLQLIPKAQRFAAVMQKNIKNVTVLCCAALYPDRLQTILKLLPKSVRYKAMMKCDHLDKTLLHHAVSNVESLRVILKFISVRDFIAAINERDKENRTVLHEAVANAASLSLILQLLLPGNLLPALNKEDKYGHTPLYLAALKTDALPIILKLLTPENLFALINKKDIYGNTVLHQAVLESECLSIMLKQLPPNYSLAVMSERDNQANTVLHRASSQPRSLEMILKLLPQPERLPALKEINEHGQTVLHAAALRHQSLKAILDLLSEEDFPAALTAENGKGQTVLQTAVYNIDKPHLSLLTDILKTLHVSDYFIVFNEETMICLAKADAAYRNIIINVMLGESFSVDSYLSYKMLDYLLRYTRVIALETDPFTAVIKLLTEYSKNEPFYKWIFSYMRQRRYMHEARALLLHIQERHITLEQVVHRLEELTENDEEDELTCIKQLIKHNYSGNRLELDQSHLDQNVPTNIMF